MSSGFCANQPGTGGPCLVNAGAAFWTTQQGITVEGLIEF